MIALWGDMTLYPGGILALGIDAREGYFRLSVVGDQRIILAIMLINQWGIQTD